MTAAGGKSPVRLPIGQLVGSRLSAVASLPGPFATAVAGETLLVLFAAFLLLGNESFWLDEAVSWDVARRDWEAFARVVARREANQAAYYALLKLWIMLGDSEFWLRSLSAIFAAATVPALALLGRRLFDARVGLTAGLLLSFNPFFLSYAQEARSYSLVLLTVTVMSYVLVRWQACPSRHGAVAYVVLSVVAVWAHIFAALVVAAHILFLVGMRTRGVPIKLLGATVGAIVFFLSPLGAWVLVRTFIRPSGQLAWVQFSGFDDLVLHFVRLAGGWGPFAVYGLLAAVAIAPVVALATRRKRDPARWPVTMVLVWMLFPTAVTFVVSYVSPILVSRFLIVTLPALILLAAVGISRARGVAFGGGLLLLAGVASLPGIADWYVSDDKSDWRSVTDYVVRMAQPGDAILFDPYWDSVAFEYYRARTKTATPPLVLLDHSRSPAAPLDGRWGLLWNGSYDRLWLVTEGGGVTLGEEFRSNLKRTFTVVSERDFPGGSGEFGRPLRVVLLELTRLRGHLNAGGFLGGEESTGGEAGSVSKKTVEREESDERPR